MVKLLRDEIEHVIDEARYLKYGIVLRRLRHIDPKELLPAIMQEMSAAGTIIQSFTRLMHGPLVEALGKSGDSETAGIPGDPNLLEFVAHSVGEVHRQTIEWGLSWLHVKCQWREADRLLSIFLG